MATTTTSNDKGEGSHCDRRQQREVALLVVVFLFLKVGILGVKVLFFFNFPTLPTLPLA